MNDELKFVELSEPTLLPNIFRKGQECSKFTLKRYVENKWTDVGKGYITEMGEVYITHLLEGVTIEDIIMQMHTQVLAGRDY